MKKLSALALILVMSVSTTAGALADTLGLGVVTNIASSASAAADADGAGQVDTTICTLTVDENGVIVEIEFDMTQTQVTFNAKGEITADLNGEYLSKYELGEAYGMKKASSISKEWFEQVDALVAYCTGKTLDQVLQGVSEDKSSAVAEDLKAGATLHLNDFIAALEKAYAAATKK